SSRSHLPPFLLSPLPCSFSVATSTAEISTLSLHDALPIYVNPNKFEIAKSLGATNVYNSSDKDVVANIKEETGGGLDYVFETAGVVPAMEVAYKITKRGGTTTTTGLPHPEHEFSFPQVTLAAEERTVKGSYVGSCVPPRDIPHFVDLYK